MAGQDDKKRAHAGEEAPARMESDCETLPENSQNGTGLF